MHWRRWLHMLILKTTHALFIVFFVHRPFNFLFTKEYLKQSISCVGSLSRLAYITKIILLIMSQQNITSVLWARPVIFWDLFSDSKLDCNLWHCLNVYLAANSTTMTTNFTIIKPRGQHKLLRFGGKYCKAISFHNGWKFDYISTSIVSRSDLCLRQHLRRKAYWLRLICSCVALR